MRWAKHWKTKSAMIFYCAARSFADCFLRACSVKMQTKSSTVRPKIPATQGTDATSGLAQRDGQGLENAGEEAVSRRARPCLAGADDCSRRCVLGQRHYASGESYNLSRGRGITCSLYSMWQDAPIELEESYQGYYGFQYGSLAAKLLAVKVCWESAWVCGCSWLRVVGSCPDQ